jgi:hypothetical protein
VYIAPNKPTLWEETQLRHCYNDSSSNSTAPPRRETTPKAPPPQGFPPLFEEGSLVQTMTDAFKKVTTPTGVAVVSAKQGFLLAGPTHEVHRSSLESHHRREENHVSSSKKRILTIKASPRPQAARSSRTLASAVERPP